MPPLPGNLLARAAQAGRQIVSVGKIGDIFAHRDTGLELKGGSNDEHVDLTLRALRDTGDGGLIFANLVDFDTEFGHRRDVRGLRRLSGGVRRAACRRSRRRCARAISASSPPITATIRPGAATTTRASTRRSSPSATRQPKPIGERATFADIAETVAAKLGLPKGPRGASWL